MYRLLSGLHAHLTRKEEFNVIILGLDHAGKTTFLEKVKTIYNSPSQPGLKPSQISPTMGQNIGKITISSSYLQFWDLGGSKEIRPIWEKYFLDADGICWILDSKDRNKNGWPLEYYNNNNNNNNRNLINQQQQQQQQKQQQESPPPPQQQQQQQQQQGNASGALKGKGKAKELDDGSMNQSGEGWIELQKVLRHPSIAQANLPLLVIANKQDDINSKHLYRSTEPGGGSSSTSSSRRPTKPSSAVDQESIEEGLLLLQAQEGLESEEEEVQPMSVEEVKELFNRLVMESDRSEKARALGLSEAHVVGVSALNGQGIREAINWLFYRVASKGQSRKTLAAAAALADLPPETSRSSGPGVGVVVSGGGGGGGSLGRPIRLGTMSK